MSDPVSNAEVEDVLASIRRLVSEEKRPSPEASKPAPDDAETADGAGDDGPGRLLLTQSLRVRSAQAAADGDMAQTPADAELAPDTADETPVSENVAEPEHPAEPSHNEAAEPDALEETASLSDMASGDVASGTEEGAADDADADTEMPPDANEIDMASLEIGPLDLTGMEDPDPDFDELEEDMPFEIEDPLHQRALIEQMRNAEGNEHSNLLSGDEMSEAEGDGTFGDNPSDVDDAAQAEEISKPILRAVTSEDAPADAEPDDTADAQEEDISSLGAKIAALEAAVGLRQDNWEPDGTDENEGYVAATAVAPVTLLKDVSKQATDDDAGDDKGSNGAQAGSEDADALAERTAALFDEDSLRDMVSEIVREELQGALGERITRNVRKLVRREIQRALTAQDLE